VCLLAGARAAVATMVLPLDLDAMTAAADRVFVGRVVTVRSGRDDHGLPVTWTTFTVEDALKGAPPKTLEIKQLGVDRPLADGGVFRIPALPTYRVGEEVVLFLHPDSRQGFTSPVGLGQGRFRVRRDGGSAVVENDVGNSNLAAPSAARATARVTGGPAGALGTPAPIALDNLVARVRAATHASR
jgi:hypothetical protein